MNYYPRYPAHYVAKTLHLTMEQDGAYTRLLDWYYGNERGIPHAQRYAISRAQTPSEKRSTDAVLKEFFTLDSGVWTNGRAVDEIAEAQPKIEAARANGRKGGRPRKNPMGSSEKPGGFSTETQSEPSAKAPQSPIPINSTDRSVASTPAAALAQVGVLECHESSTSTPNPVAAFARALTSAGFQVTSLNPELVAYVDEGGSVEHLLEVAQFDKCRGKNGTYVAKAARGELAERASAITPGGSHASPRKLAAAEQTRAAIAGRAGDGFEYG